jgi:hypothetical protein
LPGHLRAEGRMQLCNFHAWLLAKSAPADVAASLFLNALRVKDRDTISTSPSACSACEKIRTEEVTRLEEVTRELEQSSLTNVWLQQHGRFCLRHMRELKKRVPASLRNVVAELDTRNATELEGELQEFLQQARRGDHAGGGVLGRAAEFLVAQRGILD